MKDKTYGVTFTLEPDDQVLMDKLIASYGDLKPSTSAVVKMLVIGALHVEARAKGWIEGGPEIKNLHGPGYDPQKLGKAIASTVKRGK